MNTKTQKALRISAISLTSALFVLIAGIAIIINFIFTPEKLTPEVLRIANSSLNAKLNMKSVELTFFSTFPRFGLKLTDGLLISKAVHDSTWQQTDSLLSFKECLLVVNPIDYMNQEKITINQLNIDKATVYAYKNKEGIANWNIIKNDSTITEQPADKETSTGINGGISIKQVNLRNTNIFFDDRETKVYAKLENANLKLNAEFNKEASVLNLNFNNDNILFWQDGQLLVNHIATEIKTNLEVNRNSNTLKVNKALVSINGLKLDVQGSISSDSLKQEADVNLSYGLHAPSLETILLLIPENILKKGKMNAGGEVKIEGTIKGKYGQSKMPKLTCSVNIKNASAQYDEMPYAIDNITASFYSEVDLMRTSPSYADLKIFRFQGAHTDVLANAKVQDLLGDPDITFHTTSTIDLTALSKTFPLQEGVSIQGKLNANLDMHCRLSSIRKRDIGRIKAKGKLTTQELSIQDKNKGFDFTSNASFLFTGNEMLEAEANIENLILHSNKLSSILNSFKAQVRTTNPQDTTRIANLTCKLEMKKLKASITDSLGAYCGRTTATIHLQPGKLDPSKPQIGLSLDADSLFARIGENKVAINKAGFAISAEKIRDSVWNPKGIIGFNRMIMKTPTLSLPILLHKTAVTVGNRTITLKNASMKIGKSDITASGAVYNLYEAMRKHSLLRAHLSLSSENLDCNQLINAMTIQQDSTLQDVIADTNPTDSLKTEETDLSLFVVPKNIDFELQTNLKKVTYGKMLFENVHGLVDVRNQAIHLKNLSMNGMNAQMNTTLVYQTEKKEEGYVGFDFRLHDVNIAKLVDFAPSLDTIVPMLRSFKGVVDFDITAEAVLDSNLYIKVPTLRSAMHIKGDSLVLMDGETFAEISKILMFKNKKRNVFDSISVNILVKNGDVTIYPFEVNIDRYKAAIGGRQGLDMNFDYHISILKSPLPFKAGVNITGTLDDMKIRIGKAKYKNAVTPTAIQKVDSTRMNLGAEIVRDFIKVMQRRKNQNRHP